MPVEITHSEFDTHATCPLFWKFRYIEKLKPKTPSVKLSVGGAIHAGVEQFYRRGEDPMGAMSAYCDRVRRKADETGLPLDESYEVELRKAAVLMEGYLARYAGDFERYAVVTVEPTFSIPLPGVLGVRIAGKFDRIVNEKGSGLILLTETKTAAQWDPDVNRLMLDPQVSIYSWALSKILRVQDVTVLYDVIKKPSIRQRQDESQEEFFERLRTDVTGNPDKYFIRDRVTRSRMEIERTEQELQVRGREMKRLRKNPAVYRTPGDHCFWKCPYMRVCLEDTPEMREALYVTDGEIHVELSLERIEL